MMCFTPANVYSICILLALAATVRSRSRVYNEPVANIPFANMMGNFAASFDSVVANMSSVGQSPITQTLCSFKTNELCEYYNYDAETHYVTTDDGYILTVFRCSSKVSTFPLDNTKKAVIIMHDFLGSSDDFCIGRQDIDALYDVWLPNWRGNTYSKNPTSKSPNEPSFWDFTFHEIGTKDYPAVIEYVRDQTSISKVFVVAYSQGATSLMVLLSEIPEYNQYIAAASLMAPVSYLNNSADLYKAMAGVTSLMKPFGDSQIFPRRNSMNSLTATVCEVTSILNQCNTFLNTLFGQSRNQGDNILLPARICHQPNGASLKQLLHFCQEMAYGFFGKYMTNGTIPNNYDLSKITIPISPNDSFTNPKDINRLTPQLKHLIFVQTLNETPYNHIDFVAGSHAAFDIYSRILMFFEMQHMRSLMEATLSQTQRLLNFLGNF